jgi:hypothetical protein
MSFLTDADQVPTTDNYEMELTQNDEGEVVYRARVRSQKKLLGLIPWEFESEYELNDATGDVSLIQDPSLIAQLFSIFSQTK